MKTRKLKINKFRVIIFLLLMLISSTGLKIQKFDHNDVYKPDPKIVYHYVGSNETIWQIADMYYHDNDKREFVNQILELNDNNSTIYQGQILLVPGNK